MSDLDITGAIILVLSVSTVWTGFLFFFFARWFSKRFSNLTNIFVAAMADRDAAYQKLRAQVARDYIMDASTFDSSLEDVSDFMPPSASAMPNPAVPDPLAPIKVEESDDEREEEDQRSTDDVSG